MKVLLISNPPERKHKPDFPPLGIVSLGAVSNSLGYDTKLIDSGLLNIPDILKEIKRYSPKIIGITCWTIDRGKVWELCHYIKEISPDSILILGGPHATIFPEHVFIKTHASAVAVGEGEDTFREFLLAVDGKLDINSVRGLYLKKDDNSIFFTGERELINNLDLLPKLYYSGIKNFKFSNYAGFPCLNRPTASIISSRGCVYNCNYCSSTKFWKKRWRYRSSASILNEIEWLVKEMGVKSIYFFDDNFTVLKKRVIEICEGIKNIREDLEWSCCSHVKSVDLDLLKAMKDGGCVSIDFGVESGSNKILKSINKNQTSEDIKETFKQVHNVGIKPRAYLMIGNMGEDEDTINETIELVGEIKPYSSLSGVGILWLLPGTKVYNDAVENNYIEDKYWLNTNDIPYNLQEYSYKEMFKLRKKLMYGIAKKLGGIYPIISFYLKTIYYKYPFLSFLRPLVPKILR